MGVTKWISTKRVFRPFLLLDFLKSAFLVFLTQGLLKKACFCGKMEVFVV